MKRFFLLVLILTSSSLPLFALDWDQEKYDLPEADPNWLSQVKPESDEFSQICMASQRQVLDRVLKEKKIEFRHLVKKAGNIILSMDSRIVDQKYLNEWHQAFVTAQKSWLRQLEREGKDYVCEEGSLGGNSCYQGRSYFMISLIEERMKNIKNRWWFKDTEKIAKSG